MPIRNSLIANLFFLAMLFPFISLVPTPFDVQPYCVAAALLLICIAMFLNRMRLPAVLWLLAVPAFYAMCILWIPGLPNVAGARAVNGYLSLFAISAAAYVWARYFNLRLFHLAVYVWLTVALIQFFVYRDFGGWLLPRFDPDYQFYRGVVSLATEPAHYAQVCLFFLLFNELLYSYGLYPKKPYVIIQAALATQMIMSFSALGLIYLFIFIFSKLGIFFMGQLSPKALGRALLVLLAIVATAALTLNSNRLRSSRGVRLARLVIENPSLLQEDTSIRQRLNNVVLPVVGLFRSSGTGFGLTSWQASAPALMSGSDALVRFPTPEGRRIASGWGSTLFELGIVGVSLIVAVSWVMIQGMGRDRRRRGLYLVILISMHAAMTNATPLAFPPFGFLIGMCAVFVRKPPHQWPTRWSPTSRTNGLILPHTTSTSASFG